MERKISISLYLWAFLISLAIFLVGLYLGAMINSSASSTLSREVASISSKVASTSLLLLSEGNSSAFCPVYLSELDEIDKEIELLGHKLTYLENEKNTYDNELKKKYFVLEAESYLISKKAKERCNINHILLINFYSNKGCDKCRDQGTEILKARDQLSQMGAKIKLFSFDGEIGSPVSQVFKEQFNVSKYPTIVINEKVFPGYSQSDKIKDYIKRLN